MATSAKNTIWNLSYFNRKPKKFAKRDQAYFLATLAELHEEGFSLAQSLQFIKILIPKYQDLIDAINESLAQGTSFEKAIQPYDFSNLTIAQIFFGQRQGRFSQSLKQASQQISSNLDYQNKFIKTLTYPMIMSVFLVLLLLGLRSFLLPHIASFISQESYDNSALIRVLISFFSFLPHLTGLVIASGILGYLLLDNYLARLPLIEAYQFLVKLPIIARWVRQYLSHLLSQELGYFYSSGYSIQQIVQVLVDYPIHPFLSELAQIIEVGLLEGQNLIEIIADLDIFTPELPVIIQQGELMSQSGPKCLIYSRKVFSDLMADIEKKIAMIQPILFIVIAVLVMAMYLLMMLPMFTMEV